MLSIATDRLTMRLPISRDASCHVSGDAARITDLLQQRDIVSMLGRAPWPYRRSDADAWIALANKAAQEEREFAFVIEHDTHGIIGSTGVQKVSSKDNLSPPGSCVWELGYWIGKPYWGHGFVTEAARGLLQWARDEHNATGFVSGHIDDNAASGAVLRKLGFTDVGVIEHYARGRDAIVRARRYVLDAPAALALAFDGH